MSSQRYEVIVHWSWGRFCRFQEVYRFGTTTPETVAADIKAFVIPHIVKQHAFDCRRVDHPLLPTIDFIKVVPVGKEKYVETAESQLELGAAVERVRMQLEKERG